MIFILFSVYNFAMFLNYFLVPSCLKEGIVKQIFPLHDEDEIRKLASSWYMTMFSPQPFGNLIVVFIIFFFNFKIKNYFCVYIAIKKFLVSSLIF